MSEKKIVGRSAKNISILWNFYYSLLYANIKSLLPLFFLPIGIHSW